MESEKKQWLNEVDVSGITKMALSTLRNHRFQKRGIPYVKFGRSVRYSFSDVLEYMEGHKIHTEDSSGAMR
jgi:hypothetical protein